MIDRITIVNTRPPTRADLNTELQWLGATLGLFNERDKDSSCFRVFVTLVRASQHNQQISSDEIASQTSLSRGTVVHHLNKLRDAGLINLRNQRYELTGASLQQALHQVHNEMQEMLRLIDAVARDIDSKLR